MGKSGARLSSPAHTAGMETSVNPGDVSRRTSSMTLFVFLAAHLYVRKTGRRGITKNERERKELRSVIEIVEARDIVMCEMASVV
jgi:hypothetical protein